MLGWSAGEMVGRSALECVHPGDHERAVGRRREMRASRRTQRVRLRHRHRAGHRLWVEIENVFVGLDDPDVVYAERAAARAAEEGAVPVEIDAWVRPGTGRVPIGAAEVVACV